MRIDVTKPEGNTFAALGHALLFLQRSGAAEDYIAALRRDVFKASCAAAARNLIEERTGGAISFYDPSKRT